MTQARWTAEPGRHIHFDGQPFVHIDREKEALPVEADRLVHFIVESLNSAEMTPDELYKQTMGFPPRQAQRHAREARSDRPISMSYGALPDYKQFKHDIHTRIDPEKLGGKTPYWPRGMHVYPMELVGSHEIELAQEYGGLNEFETDRYRSGHNTNAIGFSGDEQGIYDFLRFLKEKWEEGDEEAGDLASSIMTTLGYEWI